MTRDSFLRRDGSHVAFLRASVEMECKYQTHGTHAPVFHKRSGLLPGSLYKRRKQDDDQ